MLNILVVDDHEFMRRGVRALLETRSAWKVVAEAANGQEAVRKAKEFRPDIVILDISMPELNGLDATRRIHQLLPQTEILILTVHESDQLVREALDSGARGYLSKSDAARDLMAAVELLARRKQFLSSRVAHAVESQFSTRGSPDRRLTPREREILQLLAEGNTNKEVAIKLNISLKTAETHRTNIMRKIGVHSFSDLVRYAIRNEIVEP